MKEGVGYITFLAINIINKNISVVIVNNIITIPTAQVSFRSHFTYL